MSNNWYRFNLKSTNFVIVLAPDRVKAKETFLATWPKESARIKEEHFDMNEMPDGAVEVLTAR